jgi:L-iditol 2-dehydrogenase
LLEPLGVAIHALDLSHLRFGATVAVVGCGPIGLLLVQLARAAGAGFVLAADPRPHRRDAALRLGADAAHADPTSAPDAMRQVDVAFEVAGTDAAVDVALTLARPGARVMLLGIPDDDRASFSASLARRKGLTLMLVRRMGEVYQRAIEAAARGAVGLASLVSARYPLERSAEAFRYAESRDGLKTVIEP